jgi:hypothetical protein
MELKKEINLALKITLLYAIITGVFTLLGRIAPLFPIGGDKVSLQLLIQANFIWIVVVIITILALSIYVKKVDGKFDLAFLNDPTIRLTIGFLTIVSGIFNLAIRISTLVFNLINLSQSLAAFNKFPNNLITHTLLSNIIPLSINLLQIILGLFLVLYKGKNKELD